MGSKQLPYRMGQTMKLYELTDRYREVLDQLSEPDDEAAEDERCQTLLLGLSDAFDDKVLGIAKVIRSMHADVAAIAGELDRLQARKRHLAGRIDWLKRYLLAEMEAVGREKIRGSTLTVALAKSPPSCDVASIDDVPEEFKRMRVEADRLAILKHFRSTGELVPGTTVITDRKYVRII